MEFYNTVVRFFQEGGSFMLPIALVLAIGLAIAIERFLVLAASKRANSKAYKQFMPLLTQGDFNKVLDTQKSTSGVGQIIQSGIERLQHTQRREEIEFAMEEQVLEIMPKLEKRTAYLATLANIATLLGLLGTIIGLIAAFSAVADADPAEKASLLSASISVAMNTTAFGLIAAIPLLVFHSVLQTKTTEIIDGLEMAGVKCLNLLTKQQAVTQKTRSTD